MVMMTILIEHGYWKPTNQSGFILDHDIKIMKRIFENILLENILLENTLLENTLSENTLLENTLSENTLWENTFSETTLSKKHCQRHNGPRALSP